MEVVNSENAVENDLKSDTDMLEKVNELVQRIEQLETEKKKQSDEFNSQRAKLKELFIQKEEQFKLCSNKSIELAEHVQKLQGELDEARSQLLVAGLRLETDLEDEKRKAQEQIATLEQLCQETMEESTSSRSIYDNELKKLQLLTQKLQIENNELRSLNQQSSPHHSGSDSLSGSLAPGIMLSAVTKSLARKLGADSFTNQENLEESMRKAQEDAEMLRSLVEPLEEEIKQLKDKLRATDEQLQHCRQCGHLEHVEVITRLSTESSPIKETEKLEEINPNETDSPSQVTVNGDNKLNSSIGREKASPTPCDMCNNYETQLVHEQQKVAELGKKLALTEKTVERQREDLIKEINIRKEMEEKWNEKKEEHKEQVTDLNKRTLCTEQDLKELRQTFEQTVHSVQDELTKLTREREEIQQYLDRVQRENNTLVGKYMKTSAELQNETINYPDNVAELQELLLKNHENLITTIIGKEVALGQVSALQGEIKLIRDQHLIDQQTRQELENSLVTENDGLRKKLERVEHETTLVAALKERLAKVSKTKDELEEKNNELRSRVTTLQQELGNSEEVQKDFVRLSQSLQVELEKIRGSDTQVRWQHDEDVTECPTCHNGFSGSRKKTHCRHCGQIFCNVCLTHTVTSGPNQRPSKVCHVCHTLLNRDTAPYFSTKVPNSPG